MLISDIEEHFGVIPLLHGVELKAQPLQLLLLPLDLLVVVHHQVQQPRELRLAERLDALYCEAVILCGDPFLHKLMRLIAGSLIAARSLII